MGIFRVVVRRVIWGVLAMLAVGCAAEQEDEAEELGISREALITTTKINVGDGTSAYSRWLYKDDVVREYRLLMTSTAATPLPAYTHHWWLTLPWGKYYITDDGYEGCGRKAAQNALNWFGIRMTQAAIGDYVEGHDIPLSDKIATYPDELRDGLQQILDRYSPGDFRAVRRSHVTREEIRTGISKGFPVIALVNNGSHWVVVGAGRNSAGQWWVIDDFSASWKGDSALNLQFSGLPAWYSAYDIFSSYEEGTIITFERDTATSGGGGGTSPYPIRQY